MLSPLFGNVLLASREKKAILDSSESYLIGLKTPCRQGISRDDNAKRKGKRLYLQVREVILIRERGRTLIGWIAIKGISEARELIPPRRS